MLLRNVSPRGINDKTSSPALGDERAFSHDPAFRRDPQGRHRRQPDGENVRDIGIAGGRIAELGPLSQTSAAEVIDCKGLHILPGVMDTQVHFREPGLEQKEDLETGSRSS